MRAHSLRESDSLIDSSPVSSVLIYCPPISQVSAISLGNKTYRNWKQLIFQVYQRENLLKARADGRCYLLFLLSRCKIPGQFDYHIVFMHVSCINPLWELICSSDMHYLISRNIKSLIRENMNRCLCQIKETTKCRSRCIELH